LGGAVALLLIAQKRRFGQTARNVGTILGSLAHGRAPHRIDPQLDVQTDAGMRLAYGAVIAVAAGLYVLASA
jgi:hypothetical protein